MAKKLFLGISLTPSQCLQTVTLQQRLPAGVIPVTSANLHIARVFFRQLSINNETGLKYVIQHSWQ